jgi:pimeloyl-ACP methyl ester carboxylesterase
MLVQRDVASRVTWLSFRPANVPFIHLFHLRIHPWVNVAPPASPLCSSYRTQPSRVAEEDTTMSSMTKAHKDQIRTPIRSAAETHTRRCNRGWRQWIQRISLGAAAVVLVVTSTTLMAGAAAKARLKAQYPPIGRMVDMGGYRMHVVCQGSGSPTVLLEAGAGGFDLHWTRVQPEVAKTARVCAYDRAGYGWSDRSPKPRTAEVMAEELATLLTRANIAGPYVLVGHSLGGPIIRQFTAAHPEEVVGMVLVDSAHEQQFAHIPEPIRVSQNSAMRPLRLMTVAAGAGLLALRPSILALPLLGEAAPTAQALVASGSEHLATMLDETVAAGESISPVPTLGDIPLVVLRHGRTDLPVRGAVTPAVVEEYEANWVHLQTELAALSPQGKLVVAEQSGHDIHLEQPELVIDAIHEVLAAGR